MAYGNLHVFTGPMFAGKTEELLKEVLFKVYYATDDLVVRTYKPAVDDRYDGRDIVSHAGSSVSAQPISSASEIDPSGADAVFLDEVQFFGRPHFDGDILGAVRALRLGGTDVYCSGLDMDYLGHAFEITAALMAEASEIRRLTARCAHAGCAAPATHSVRFGSVAERIVVGSHGDYAPMCAEHWAASLLKPRSWEEGASSCRGGGGNRARGGEG